MTAMDDREIRIRWDGENLIVQGVGFSESEMKQSLGVALAQQFHETTWYQIRRFFVELEQQTRALAFQTQADAKAGRELIPEELYELARDAEF